MLLMSWWKDGGVNDTPLVALILRSVASHCGIHLLKMLEKGQDLGKLVSVSQETKE